MNFNSHLSNVKSQKQNKPNRKLGIPNPPKDYYNGPILENRVEFSSTKHYHFNNEEYLVLETDFKLQLCNGDPIKCHTSSCGMLWVEILQKCDIRYLNAILYRLTGAAKLRDVRLHYYKTNADEPDGDFFPIDRESKFFNKSRQILQKSDFIKSFQGRVAISIKGLRVCDNYHVFLLISIFQVLVENEDDILTESINDCIF